MQNHDNWERRRSDLPKGGLEVPCILLLEHEVQKILMKAKKLFNNKGCLELVEAPTVEPTKPSSSKSKTETVKKRKVPAREQKRQSN